MFLLLKVNGFNHIYSTIYIILLFLMLILVYIFKNKAIGDIFKMEIHPLHCLKNLVFKRL